MDVLFQWLISVWDRLWPFEVVRAWERGLLVIWGRWVVSLPPGVWARIPLIMEFEKDIVTEEPCDLPHQYLQTLDGLTIGISGRLTYRISDLKQLFLTIHDHEEWLITVAMGLLAENIQDANWDDIDEQLIVETVLPQLQGEAGAAGLQVTRFEITHLSELTPYYLVLDGAGGVLE